jgi:hypothetical protein
MHSRDGRRSSTIAETVGFNAAERALRAVAIGRKNYLFAGSDSGDERAAAIYSLIGSAQLNNLDPEAYLREVLARIADHPIKRVTELPLWNVALSGHVLEAGILRPAPERRATFRQQCIQGTSFRLPASNCTWA